MVLEINPPAQVTVCTEGEPCCSGVCPENLQGQRPASLSGWSIALLVGFFPPYIKWESLFLIFLHPAAHCYSPAHSYSSVKYKACQSRDRNFPICNINYLSYVWMYFCHNASNWSNMHAGGKSCRTRADVQLFELNWINSSPNLGQHMIGSLHLHYSSSYFI